MGRWLKRGARSASSVAMMSLKLLLVVGLVGCVVGDTVNLNQLVDQLLSGLDQQLIQQGKDKIPIDELHTEFKVVDKRWLKITAEVNCWNGYARSLASLHRTGDVTMTTSGNTVTLSANLGLGTLEFGFEQVQFKCRLFSFTERCYASVRSNSIAAQITLTKNGNQCVANVDRLEFTDLGRIDLNTGSGALHKYQDKLFNWLLDHFDKSIKSSINNALMSQAQDKIGSLNLCEKIPF